MKIYDKEMFKRNEVLKSTTMLLIVFLLGFLVGYLTNMDKANIKELQNQIEEKDRIINSYEANQI